MKYLIWFGCTVFGATLMWFFSHNSHTPAVTSQSNQKVKSVSIPSRSLSNASSNYQFVSKLNNDYLLTAYDQASFKSMLDNMLVDESLNAISNKNDANDPNLVVTKMYLSFAKLIQPLEGFVWKLGGVAKQSEYIYKFIIETFTKIAYSKHLYSKTVAGFMEYLVKPTAEAQRFESISDVQDFISNSVIDNLSNSIAEMEGILTDYKEWNSFQFDFDYALVVNGNFENNNANGRYEVFTRTHLVRTVSYMKNILGSLQYFNAINLDALPKFLNEALWTSVKGTKVQLFNFRNWFTEDARNMHLMTPDVYRKILFKNNGRARRKYKDFMTLKNGGEELLVQAKNNFAGAIDLDIDYIQQMNELAQYPNQDQYIVDTRYVLNDPALEINRLEKIQEALAGETDVTDPVTGESVRINLPILFTKEFAQDLKAYLPNQFAFTKDMSNARIMVNGKPSFLFSYARPSGWPDPTLAGVFKNANNNNLYDIHRVLTNNGDLDVIGNIIFYFLY